MTVNKFLGACLLIASTTIGAAMIAMPVSTSTFGLLPTALLFLLSWSFMLVSAYLILEVNLRFSIGSNMLSMAQQTLGRFGQVMTWSSYLLLLYALMAAYLSGLGSLISEAVGNSGEFSYLSLTTLVFVFSAILTLGTKTTDIINRLFLIGLLVCFVMLVFLIGPHIDTEHLAHVQFSGMWQGLPIILTAFGFHIIIPTIRTYLDHDVEHTKKAIFFGALIPLVVYLIWEVVILGVAPTHKLQHIMMHGDPEVGLTQMLDGMLHNPLLTHATKLLTIFAITTSFIGVSLSLFDFLSDALRLPKSKLGRITTAAITFIPPALFNLAYPRGFMLALNYAGIFVALLLGIIPCLMVWRSRYVGHHDIDQSFKVPGGRWLLILTLLFFSAIICIELYPR